jgi:diaminopimelate epimerase
LISMKLKFTKMTGAGNDFVVLDNRNGDVKDGPGLARRLCDRHFGIGADGLLLVETSSKADFRMMYYNADGSYGGMCGNGGRCAARFAVINSIAGEQQEFEALDWTYAAVVAKSSVALRMKDPSGLRTIVLPTSRGTFKGRFVDTGSPHVVLSVRDLGSEMATLDVEGLGREIRHHREFQPQGTNVNFVQVTGKSSLALRTYERGVEAETLACGTGSIAAAIACWADDLVQSPVTVKVRSGSELVVEFKTRGGKEAADVVLRGPADVVFEGLVEI